MQKNINNSMAVCKKKKIKYQKDGTATRYIDI